MGHECPTAVPSPFRNRFLSACLSAGAAALPMCFGLSTTASASAQDRALILARLPLPAGGMSGRVEDVAESGAAVGSYTDSRGLNRPYAYVSGSAFALDLAAVEDADEGRANAIADLDSGSLRVVGEAVTTQGRRAVYWDGIRADATLIPAPPGDSTATAVTADGLIAGYSETATGTSSFVFDPSTGDLSIIGAGEDYMVTDLGASPRGETITAGCQSVGAADHAYVRFDSGRGIDGHPGAAVASGVERAFARFGDAVGWVQSPSGQLVPAYWRNLGRQISVYAPFGAADAVASDMNSFGETVISRMDGEPGAALWTLRAGVAHRADLQDITFMRDEEHRIASATSINERLWIGGSYLAHGDAAERPCLVIPYDIDNDDIPDIRQMLDDPALDANDDFVLDHGQNVDGSRLRVGLHGVSGTSSQAQYLPHVQIVRMPYSVSVVRAILDDPAIGEDFAESLNVLGSEPWPGGTAREILVNIASDLPIGYKTASLPGWQYSDKYDYIPPTDAPRVEGELIRAEVLDYLRCFAAQVARNVDYVQIGNETIGGHGEFWIGPEDLPEDPDWSGGILRQVESEHLETAADRVYEWLEEMAWAVREASALAGRPIRIVGPATTRNMTYHAMQQESASSTRHSFLVARNFAFGAHHADISAIHLHHGTAEERGHVAEILRWVHSDSSWLVDEGIKPRMLGVTEWGPRAAELWSEEQEHEWVKYYTDWDGAPPLIPNWPDYVVAEWMSDPVLGPGADLGLPETLRIMRDTGVEFTLYGRYITGGSAADPNQFDIGSLLCPKINPMYLNDPYNWNEVTRDLYVLSTLPYVIREGFDNLHPYEQAPLVSCW